MTAKQSLPAEVQDRLEAMQQARYSLWDLDTIDGIPARFKNWGAKLADEIDDLRCYIVGHYETDA